MRLAPAHILDAGCGTGEAVGELRVRYPDARVAALDLALPMVVAARERERSGRSALRRLLPAALARGRASHFVCGDINALPFAGVAFDLVWSNLALQWVNDLPRAFAEFRRVLKVGGLLSFTTFGPDTLREVRKAFARVDGFTHTNRFVDMHDVGDMLVHAGFADPVMDMEPITVTYADPESLLRELKALGATNATRGRPHGLMGRAALAADAARARRHAHRGPPARDLRGGLRPRVEGRGRSAREDGLPIVALPQARMSARPLRHRHRHRRGQDAGRVRAAARARRPRRARGRHEAGGRRHRAAERRATRTWPRSRRPTACPCRFRDRNPYAFAAPIAPHVAARDAGVTIDLAVIAAACGRLAQRAPVVVVEGAGGARVPLGPRLDMLDLALQLQLPVLLVVGMRLGCLNHALLTADAIAARGLVLAGWVANRIDGAMARAGRQRGRARPAPARAPGGGHRLRGRAGLRPGRARATRPCRVRGFAARGLRADCR